jgi:predicted ATPase
MDVDSIGGGAEFTVEIERAIDGSEAVLVVIGPAWLEAKLHSGERRLDDTRDFVRREIEAALASEARVIPVLVGGASMPAEVELPETIRPLTTLNALELQDRRWREDMDALVEVLEGRGPRHQDGLGTLPVQPTPFLGRERELAEITELLRNADVRVLTLTGPGGIGKTRLAVQAAAGLAHAYPGGTWFVGLAAVTDPLLTLSEVASVLDIRDAAEDRLATAIAQRIGGRRTLLVFDNLEQLLPAAAIRVAELSAAAPSLDLIVSSRAPLRIAAEHEAPVGSLSEGEAAFLFIERARAVDPAFAPEDSEQPTITRICERLDRLPLAIELAAARTRLLPPTALLQRLEQRLPVLTGGTRDAPERQRTLRATIAWSYELLTEHEREVFARLAVFSGGWTLDAAEAVCEADLDTLQALIERNLIRQEPRTSSEPRYSMLQTIRDFAIELPEGTDADALRRQHAEYFLSMVVAADPMLQGGPDQQIWFERLDREHDNHRAALRWALDGGDPDLGLRLAARISIVWWLRRPLTEARRWLAEALETTQPIPSEQRALALDWAGFFAGEQADDPIPLLEASIECAQEAGVLWIEALATTNLAGALPTERRAEMLALGEEGVRLARKSGQHWILAISLVNLGEAHRELGDIDKAAAVYEESLTEARAAQNDIVAGLCLANLAEAAVQVGDLPRALSLAEEALDIARRAGDRRHLTGALAVSAWVALAERRLDEASDLFAQSLALTTDLGHRQFAVNTIHGLAGVAAARGDSHRAAALEALAEHHERMFGHMPTAADAGIHLRYLRELRAVTEEEVWDLASHEGSAMTFEEGVAYALRR